MAVGTVRRDTAGPVIESLTYCQGNRTRVAVRTVRRNTGQDLVWNYSQTAKPTVSKLHS